MTWIRELYLHPYVSQRWNPNVPSTPRGVLLKVCWANGGVGYSDLSTLVEYGDENVDNSVDKIATWTTQTKVVSIPSCLESSFGLASLNSLCSKFLVWNDVPEPISRSLFHNFIDACARLQRFSLRPLNLEQLRNHVLLTPEQSMVKAGDLQDILSGASSVKIKLSQESHHRRRQWSLISDLVSNFAVRLDASGVVDVLGDDVPEGLLKKLDFVEDPAPVSSQAWSAGQREFRVAGDFVKSFPESADVWVVKPAREGLPDQKKPLCVTHCMDPLPGPRAAMLWAALWKREGFPILDCGLGEGAQLHPVWPDDGFGWGCTDYLEGLTWRRHGLEA